MRRSRILIPAILLQFALVFAITSCGGSSSSSSKSKATKTPTATPTATPAFQAQAPINGTVAVQGGAGAAPGAGTVKASVNSSATSHHKKPASGKKLALGSSSCTATGSGTAYPDGSFAFSVCASVGDTLSLTYTSSSGTQTSLGSTKVPQTTQLATCPAGFRTFQMINTGAQTIWLGVNSGAQPAPASASFCGSTPVGSACAVPGTICSPLSKPAQCYYLATNIGETQACSPSDTTCPIGQTCNTSMGLCQWDLEYDYANTCSAGSPTCPANETCDIPLGVCLKSLTNTIPASDLTLTQAQTQVLCVPSEPAAPGIAPGLPCTQNSQCSSQQCNFYPASAPVQQCSGGTGCVCGPINPFSGGVYARTGCQPDGTNCQGGDCLSAPYQPCPVGKGAGNPASQAEFTLSEFSQDFYDVTVINGANAAIAMAPTAVPTAAAPGTDSPAEADYWCKTPGGASAQGPLPGCSWSFDTTNVNSANQTTLLTQVSLQSCSQPNPTPTLTPAPSAAATPSQSGCAIGSTCVANGAASYFCKPQLSACTSSSQCPGSMACENGFCNPYLTCSAASDCGTGQACVNGLCNGIGCTADSDCTFAKTGLESATCVSESINGGGSANVCVPLTCDSGVSCPTGFKCSSATGAGTCEVTNTACSLTSPCPSIRQSCDIPGGQTSGTCETAPQCGPDGGCPNNSVCGPNNLCVPGGVACTSGSKCPDGSSCPGSGFCPGACSTDSDCSSVAGTCVGGACMPLTADNSTNCPSGYTRLSDNTCVLTCTGSSSCTNSNVGTFCGSGEFNANVIQTCGVPTGSVWSMDDFCGISGTGTFGGVNCGASAQAGDTFANMFGCNGSATGSAVSCYNNPNQYTTCCGCPTFPNSNTGTSPSWPVPWNTTVATLACTNNTTNNDVWTGQIMPWLQYLKAGCATAYSFPFDDATSTFQCQSLGTKPPPSPTAGATPTGVPNTMNYAISFGPIVLPDVPTPTPTP